MESETGSFTPDMLRLLIVRRVVAGLGSIPVTDADVSTVQQVLSSGSSSTENFFVTAQRLGGRTAGVWRVFIELLADQWAEGGEEIAPALPIWREEHPEPAPSLHADLLNNACEALCQLALLPEEDEESEGPATGMARFDSASYRRDLNSEALVALARSVAAAGDPDVAYDLAAAPLDLGNETGVATENAARYAIELGEAAGRDHQVATCTLALALAVTKAARLDPARQLEAFDLCERAVEWLPLIPEVMRPAMAHRLLQVVLPAKYLGPLAVPLIGHIPGHPAQTQLREMLNAEHWPARISTAPRADWSSAIKSLDVALRWGTEVDAARLQLEPLAPADRATAAWNTRRMDHPAYRNAVPLFRSFLKERDFDIHYLVLAHELTHVLSMGGALGLALSALDVAALEAELRGWAATAGSLTSSDLMIERVIESAGVMPLPAGSTGLLPWVERKVDLALKRQLLQDTWTAWFEGLAIFGETSADPALNVDAIDAVNEALRTLIDFYPDAVPESEEDVQRAFEEFATEFEQRCSRAITARGADRLYGYLRRNSPPYFPGYIAVRAVVSAWRQTLGRPVDAAQLITLLLHATRFGSHEAIPDLSLPVGTFATLAQTLMVDWVARLAGLGRESLEDFLASPGRSGAGRQYIWRDWRLIRVDTLESQEAEGAHLAELRLQQALDWTPESEPSGQAAVLDDVTASVRRGFAEAQAATPSRDGRWMTILNRLVTLNNLLPIGRSTATFYMNVDPGEPVAWMATTVRTSEAGASGEPLINRRFFSVDRAAAGAIERHYKKTRQPRMEVVRLIDVDGLLLGRRIASHLLSHRYGDWFDLRTSNPFLDKRLAADQEAFEHVVSVARDRLYPVGAVAAVDLMTTASADLSGVHSWLTAPSEWQSPDLQISLKAWAQWIANKLDAHGTADQRLLRQQTSAHALIARLLGSARATDICDVGFTGLTEAMPASRYDLASVFLQSGRRPGAEQSMEPLLMSFNATAAPLFARMAWGWDVQPPAVPVSDGAKP